MDINKEIKEDIRRIHQELSRLGHQVTYIKNLMEEEVKRIKELLKGGD